MDECICNQFPNNDFRRAFMPSLNLICRIRYLRDALSTYSAPLSKLPRRLSGNRQPCVSRKQESRRILAKSRVECYLFFFFLNHCEKSRQWTQRLLLT